MEFGGLEMALQAAWGDFIARIRALLFSPMKAWALISIEPAYKRELFLHHILPLLAIPPLARLIASLSLGLLDFGTGLVAALFAYALGVVDLLIVAYAAAKLARFLEGQDRVADALTLVAYAATPSWIGSTFRVVPGLGILSVLFSLYSLYLLYLGAPLLVDVPTDRRSSYTALIGVVGLLLWLIFTVLLALIFGFGAVGMI